ncbi:MAG: Xaa-Pro aminopeptidase, partial [Burkholderiales bacterium PBB5]
MDTRVNPVRERLQRVREALAQHGAHALLVPSADPHLSEYLPGRWQGREWLSGFTGSMGTLAVTADRAALFADSRYWVQAERELLGSGIDLVKIPTGAATHHIQWLAQNTPAGQTVAVDGQVLGLAAAQQLHAALDAAGVTLRTDIDVLADAWPDRPSLPTVSVYAHAAPQATSSRTQRLAQVREAMARHGATQHFVSSVDDIAWITNLRGADVEYNPVFLAHLLIDATAATLFVGAGKVDAALAAELAADGLRLADYAQAGPALAALPASAVLLVDPRRITLGLRQQAPAAVKVIEAINPSTLAKSRKGEAEAQFIRQAMEEDGAAMCRFYAWFEAALAAGARISALPVADRQRAARAHPPG